MAKYSDKEVIDYIESQFKQGNVPSLREVGKHFKTSHAQIKRILKRNNYWDTYMSKLSNILLKKEKRQKKKEIAIDNPIRIYGLEDLPESLQATLVKYKEKRKPILDGRIINLEINLQEKQELKPLIEYQKSHNEKRDFDVKLRVGFISDVHLGHHHEEALNMALTYLKGMEIDVLVLGGDILDNESISYWKNKGKLTFDEEILLGREFLKQLRDYFGYGIDIYWINGNHDNNRIEKFLLNNARELINLEELQLPNLLHFDRYNIIYIDNAELLRRNKRPFRIGKLNFIHGHEIKSSWSVVNVARTMYLKAHDNIIFGHYHVSQEYIHRNIINEVRGAWAVGCMCDLSPDYAPVNNWVHGFAYVEFDEEGNFIVHNKKIVDGLIV